MEGGVMMTKQELDAALARLGFDVPEKERRDIAAATHLLEGMLARLRPPGRSMFDEPAHTVAFPKIPFPKG
jgi:hypothetical protein